MTERERILTIAAEMTGGDRAAATDWLQNHQIPGHAGKTGDQLIDEGKAESVASYLEAVHAGVYA